MVSHFRFRPQSSKIHRFPIECRSLSRVVVARYVGPLVQQSTCPFSQPTAGIDKDTSSSRSSVVWWTLGSRGAAMGLTCTELARDCGMTQSEQDEIAVSYRRFTNEEVQGQSPLYEILASVVADDFEMLSRLASLPPPKRQPNLLLAVFATSLVCRRVRRTSGRRCLHAGNRCRALC